MIVFAVYYTDKPGGFCKRLYRLFRALNAAGHEVHYCALDLPPNDVREAVHFHRIPFWTPHRSGLLFWSTFLLWSPIYLAWAARRVRPVRYVAFGAFYSTLLTVARIIHPAPLVLFLRSLVFEIDAITGKPAWVRAISGAVERFGMRTANKVVSMTQSMEDGARRFAGGRLPSTAILYNDLPPAPTGARDIRELISTKHERIALTSGVLDQRKNIADLIASWRSANGNEKESWGLVIAGRGALLEELKAAAREDSSIHFIGWVPELESYLSSVQLVLHPSRHEGISNSVLEALAAGVPVQVSDIPEHREIFPASALRVASGEWSARLSKIFNDSSELTVIREAGAATAARLRFDWDNCAVQLISES